MLDVIFVSDNTIVDERLVWEISPVWRTHLRHHLGKRIFQCYENLSDDERAALGYAIRAVNTKRLESAYWDAIIRNPDMIAYIADYARRLARDWDIPFAGKEGDHV